MKKKPLVIYWSPVIFENQDRSIKYTAPVNLYNDILPNKDDRSTIHSFFSCPAISERMKNTFVIKNSLYTKVDYNFSKFRSTVNGVSGHTARKIKPPSLINGAYFGIELMWMFFSEESVTALINTPMMHPPTSFSKSAMLPPGKMDIGQWFRPIALELQLWQHSGTLEINDGDPLFYLELLTDRPVQFKEFRMNEKLNKIMKSCSSSSNLRGYKLSLKDRYDHFTKTKTNKMVLKEIKNNLVD